MATVGNRKFKTLICTLFLALLPFLTGAGWAAPEKPDAAAAPTKKEVASLLSSVFKKKNFTVFRIAPSPVSGLWEVILETDAGKTILYIDKSKKYFLGGPIMTLEGMRNMTEESLVSSARPKVDPATVPLDDALVVGNPMASKRAVVFVSPTCEPCREMLQTIKAVSDKRKDIVFFLKMNPEEPTGESFRRSETIVLTKSLALLEDSLDGQKIPSPARPVPQVKQTMILAEKIGIQSTPTTMLADGTLVEGALPAEVLLGWIDQNSERERVNAQSGR